MTACHKVFSITELLDIIISHLDEQYNCLLVNSTFLSSTVKQLWQTPTVPINELCYTWNGKDNVPLRSECCEAIRHAEVLAVSQDYVIGKDITLPNLQTLRVRYKHAFGFMIPRVTASPKVVIVDFKYWNFDRIDRYLTSIVMYQITKQFSDMQELRIENDGRKMPMVFTREWRRLTANLHVTGVVHELDEEAEDPDEDGTKGYHHGADWQKLKFTDHASYG